MATIHKLKTAQSFFAALNVGDKTFEIRKNDRDYKRGDVLHLCEWDGQHYTGREISRKVTYVLSSDDFPQGLMPGVVCMGIVDL